MLDNGKPFCVEGGDCFRCNSDAQWTNLIGVPGKCLKTCGVCNEESNGRACVFANLVEVMAPARARGSLR